MTPSPPGTARAVWIIARLGLRRWINRLSGQFFPGKKKKGEARRLATPRKRGRSVLLIAFLGCTSLWMAAFCSFQFLARATLETNAGKQDHGEVGVTRYGFERIQKAAQALAELDRLPSGDRDALRRTPEERRERELKSLRFDLKNWSHMRLDGDLSEEEGEEQARKLVEHFLGQGIEGFRVVERHSMKVVWPPPGEDGTLLETLGLVLFLVGLCSFFSGLGMANQDLGQVSWSLEWLFTLPVPARSVFTAKVVEQTLANAMGWFLTLPFLSVSFLYAGRGWSAIPLALGATLLLGIILSSLRVAAETWLRKNCSVGRLKNIQAISTLITLSLFAILFWVAFSETIPEPFLRAARSVGPLAVWNPLSLPVLLCATDGARPMLAGGILAGVALAAIAGGTRLAERFVVDGLIVAGGAYEGRRRPSPGTIAGSPDRQARFGRLLPRGIVGKELRLLLRDRTILVQTLVLPVAMLGFQFIVNRRMMHGVAGNFGHAAAMAFGVGAYVLAFSAFHVLSMEGGALWLLYTFPQGLHAVLVRKTVLWCVVACGYTALILGAAALYAPSITLAMLLLALLALAGVVLHAFIAAGLGVLCSDPLEAEMNRRFDPVVMQLYLFVAALFAFAIYNPAVWGKIAQLILSAALAFALWQKVRDRIPYLLDPTDAPPPRIALSDGLIAILAYFVLQGLISLLFAFQGFPIGQTFFYSSLLAGVSVGLFTLYVFWRLKVPRILEEVGLSAPPDAPAGSRGRSAVEGILAGALAALLAVGYLYAADNIEALRSLKEEAQRFLFHWGDESIIWRGLLAVFVAPPVEEYLFRGLVYRGMRRSWGPVAATIFSASLFAVVHPPVSALPVFGLGLATAVVFERRGSLAAPILAHMVYNALLVALA